MDLAEGAAAWREIYERAQESLALDCAREAAKVGVLRLRSVTPKLTGALEGSEHVDAVFGGGERATAVYAPHIIYAHFRNVGGTISSKGPWSLHSGGTGSGAFAEGGQYFGRHVTQAGSHYMERGEEAARPWISEAAARVVASYFEF
jgi:hypothetical protein